MAYTLSNLLVDLLGELGVAEAFDAAGGSTTTATISELANVDRTETGWVLVQETTDGLAPQGEYARITAYTTSTSVGTYTFGALTAAVGAGDVVVIANNLYRIPTLIRKANEGMRMLGLFPLVYTGITTASDQTEYTVPVAQKHRILQVEYQVDEDDSNDNRYQTIHDWDLVPADAGSAATLVVPQFAAGHTIRLRYKGPHPVLNTYADVIHELIAPELAVKAAKVKALEWQSSRQQGRNFATQQLNSARSELNEAKAQFPIAFSGSVARMRLAGTQRG